jgi:RNA polymerase sigma factor (sigma-70 family)
MRDRFAGRRLMMGPAGGWVKERGDFAPARTEGYTARPKARDEKLTESDYEKTIVLLAKAQAGNGTAREELYRRLLPRLEAFARGRVPISMQSIADTQEIVQETLFRSLPHIDHFQPEHEGALLHYLKRSLTNRIRDLARRNGREVPIKSDSIVASPEEQSPVSQLLGEETLGQFAEALESLKPDQKMAVSLHIEMGYSLEELAKALDRGTEAARKVLERGLRNVANRMRALRS